MAGLKQGGEVGGRTRLVASSLEEGAMHSSIPGLLYSASPMYPGVVAALSTPVCQISLLYLHCLQPAGGAAGGLDISVVDESISSSELLPSSDASISSVRSAGVP